MSLRVRLFAVHCGSRCQAEILFALVCALVVFDFPWRLFLEQCLSLAILISTSLLLLQRSPVDVVVRYGWRRTLLFSYDQVSVFC